MVKNYEIENGTLKFSTNLYVLSDKKSIALLSCSYPGVKELGITKNTEIEITIKKKSEQ